MDSSSYRWQDDLLATEQKDAAVLHVASDANEANYSLDHASGILLAMAGMALLWAFLHSVTFLGSIFEGQSEQIPGVAWIVNSVCTLIVFIILFAVGSRKSPLMESRRIFHATRLCLGTGLILLLVGNFFLDSPWCNYFGNVLIACGATPMIVMWGELYKYLNPKGEQLLITLAASALAVALYLVEMLLPPPMEPFVFAILPFASLQCLLKARNLLEESSDTWRTKKRLQPRKSPALFFLCIAVFSIPYNYLGSSESLHGISEKGMIWAGVLAITIVVIIAAALAESRAERKGVLLVPGLVLFLMSAALLVDLFAGKDYAELDSALLYSGYYLFLSMIYLALGPIVSSTGINPTRLFSGAMIANVSGLLVGTTISKLEPVVGGQSTALFVLGITYALLVTGFVLLNSRSYSLFRINNFDEDEYSFEYLVPVLPFRAAGGIGAGNESAEGKTILDAIIDRCEIVGALYHLSGRENEVLVLLARGRTIASIAEEFFVSENTVKAHTKAIYRKMDVHSREELLRAIEGQEE